MDLNSIEKKLSEGSVRTRHWANAWGAVWASATGGQLIAGAMTHDEDNRKVLLVGGGASALGMIPTILMRPKIVHFEEDSRELPSSICERLAAEKHLVDEYAENDELNSGWTSHVGNVVMNLGLGALFGFGFHQWTSAALSMGLGIPVGEAMILSYPRAAAGVHDSFRTQLAILPALHGGSIFLSWNY